MDDFIEDFYAVDGFADTDYFGSLKRYGVDTESGIDSCDVDHADLELMRACITWCVRGDRFCDGCLRTYVECGFIDRCLLKLRSLTRAGRRSDELLVRLLRTVCPPPAAQERRVTARATRVTQARMPQSVGRWSRCEGVTRGPGAP